MMSGQRTLLPGPIIILIGAMVCALTGNAQQVTASIAGQITDPSGAQLANATVTAKDVDRGTTWTTVTNSSGYYNLPRVPVGKYTLRAEAKGFQASVVAPFE